MRKRALILILPFAVFITETVSFVPQMQNACILVAEPEPSCCMVKETEEQTCSMPADNDQEPEPEGCTDSPDCSTCPVCYSFICPAPYEIIPQHFILKQDYALLKASYSSSYTCSVWKPPNMLSISI